MALYVRTGNNGTDPDVDVLDLGITIPTGASWVELTAESAGDPDGGGGQFTARELRDSVDLHTLITGGSLQWSKDGATIEQAAAFISDVVLMADFEDDTLDLTSGALVFPNGDTLPASGVEGQTFWRSDQDALYLWDGTQWEAIATASGVQNDHGNLLGLDDDDHSQYLLLAGDKTRNDVSGGIDIGDGELILPHGTTTPTGSEGEVFWDDDDDRLYMFDGSTWLSIAFVSDIPTPFSGDHGDLTGKDDDDHTQYLLLDGDGTRNAVTGTIDMSGGDYFILPQATDVTTSFPAGSEGALAWDTDDETLYAHDGTQWFAIAPASGIITDHGGLTGLLDDDHTQYALLSGVATRNEVIGEFDFSDGDIILPSDGTFKGSPVEGNVEFKGGILYAYDATRSKWLSVDRATYMATRNNAGATNVYLRVGEGIATSKTGVRMLRDGTITGLFAQTNGAESWTFEVRRSGSVIASLVISAASGDQATDTNVDVSQGDEIQFYCNGTAISYPVAGIEVAWRESN